MLSDASRSRISNSSPPLWTRPMLPILYRVQSSVGPPLELCCCTRQYGLLLLLVCRLKSRSAIVTVEALPIGSSLLSIRRWNSAAVRESTVCYFCRFAVGSPDLRSSRLKLEVLALPAGPRCWLNPRSPLPGYSPFSLAAQC